MRGQNHIGQTAKWGNKISSISLRLFWKYINGSATYAVSNLEANTDASGTSGATGLAYGDVTDNAATITTGSVSSASVSDAQRRPPVPKVGWPSATSDGRKNRSSIDPPRT